MKTSRVSSPGPASAAPSGDSIGAAAKKLSDASYPFLKPVDRTSNIYLEPLSGVSANALGAVDRAIVVGAAADGDALKAASEAHHEAIGSTDTSGVTSAAGCKAVNVVLGRVVASVPTSKVMGIDGAVAKV